MTMNAFEWMSPRSLNEALQALRLPAGDPDEAPQALAGGQDLLTVLKEGLARPNRVVNLKTLPGMNQLKLRPDGLHIGALVRLHVLEEDADIRRNFPGLAEAAASIASPQIRNLATVGGNICQRPRCWYFRSPNIVCLKKGGSECYAATGENKYHAIFGGGPSFIVHPSDLAPMLVALGAEVDLASSDGRRSMPLEKFFTLPTKENVRRENVLLPGELVTSIRVPSSSLAARSTYLKFKERLSLDFALVSAAAAVELGALGEVRAARLVLGGVAPVPWRLPEAESFLGGKRFTPEVAAETARIALQGAKPLAKNGFKVPLAQALVRRALAKVAS
jgi:xanthine dehydrogenase YagS FAD-binding subunit